MRYTNNLFIMLTEERFANINFIFHGGESDSFTWQCVIEFPAPGCCDSAERRSGVEWSCRRLEAINAINTVICYFVIENYLILQINYIFQHPRQSTTPPADVELCMSVCM